MANPNNPSPLPIVSNVIAEGLTNVADAASMPAGAMIGTGLCVGAGMILAPHLLAVYGAMAVFGAAGRGSRRICARSHVDGEDIDFSGAELISVEEFLADPANQ
jgi:hypothetical protein